MSVNDTRKPSRTDWARLERMSDADIDYTDIPPLTETFFQRAKLYAPPQHTVILEEDVLAWMKQQGQNTQTLVNTILRRHIKQYDRKTKRPKRPVTSLPS